MLKCRCRARTFSKSLICNKFKFNELTCVESVKVILFQRLLQTSQIVYRKKFYKKCKKNVVWNAYICNNYFCLFFIQFFTFYNKMTYRMTIFVYKNKNLLYTKNCKNMYYVEY